MFATMSVTRVRMDLSSGRVIGRSWTGFVEYAGTTYHTVHTKGLNPPEKYSSIPLWQAENITRSGMNNGTGQNNIPTLGTLHFLK